MRQLDTRVQVVTPENIAFQYHVAGPFRRLIAYLIDLVIRVVICWITLFALSFFNLVGFGSNWIMGLWFLLFFLMTWFYGGLFETFWNGQTPGKRLMRLRVLSVEGQAINASQAVLRNLLRTVDSLPCPLPAYFPFFYLAGLISTSMNDRYQRLGDLACGTMVVVEEPHWLQGVAEVREPETLRLASLVPAWFQPDRSLARALAIYVDRRANFTPSRRHQIARYVGVPLRERFGLPRQTNLDHLLCALYNRTFVTDETTKADEPAAPTDQPNLDPRGNPFAKVALVQPIVVEEAS